MHPIRIVAALVAGVALVGAGTAGATTRTRSAVAPVCNLVADPRGDTALFGQPYKDPNLDIVSADLASDGRVVTAVIRLAGTASQDPMAPFGRTYYFGFHAPGTTNQLYLSVALDPVLGASYDYGDLEGNLYTSKANKDATGSVDAKKNALTVTAPASLGGLTSLKPGVKLTGLEVKATALVGAAGTGLVETVDTASGARPYVVGTPSCVVPGKG